MARTADDFRRWFGALSGRWRLTRSVSDGSSFAGEATFAAAGEERFLLTEDGIFLPAGAASGLTARRQWHWRMRTDGRMEIRFPDGRPYHCFDPAPADAGWTGEAVHPCGADRYRGIYRLAERKIEIVHEVEGPAKRYRLASVMVPE